MNLYSIKGLYLIFILMMTFPCAINAQQIEFTYDASGNQILRDANYSLRRGLLAERDTVSSTNRILKHNVTATPNPTEGPLRVVVTNLHETDNCSLTLFDSAGRQVFFRQIKSETSFVDLSSYTAGFYLLRLIVNDESNTIKILKQ